MDIRIFLINILISITIDYSGYVDYSIIKSPHQLTLVYFE